MNIEQDIVKKQRSDRRACSFVNITVGRNNIFNVRIYYNVEITFVVIGKFFTFTVSANWNCGYECLLASMYTG